MNQRYLPAGTPWVSQGQLTGDRRVATHGPAPYVMGDPWIHEHLVTARNKRNPWVTYEFTGHQELFSGAYLSLINHRWVYILVPHVSHRFSKTRMGL